VKLLAIETATDRCSVAVQFGEGLAERVTDAPRSHAEQVLKMVRDCLEESGLELAALDALVFGRGPGSFTGVRIATGVIQGLALGAGLPVVPVSTLAGYAAAVRRVLGAHRVAVAVDARMGECYWACYEVLASGATRLVGEECIAAPGEITPPPGPGWVGSGSGWAAYPELAAALPDITVAGDTILPLARDLLPSALAAFERGESVSAEQALPVYLRDKVAWQGESSKN
jgi:tRNA threonylcarbamoyladenosine biosynthesis protein TsaB